jgi:PAS domain S-box-containing protein
MTVTEPNQEDAQRAELMDLICRQVQRSPQAVEALARLLGRASGASQVLVELTARERAQVLTCFGEPPLASSGLAPPLTVPVWVEGHPLARLTLLPGRDGEGRDADQIGGWPPGTVASAQEAATSLSELLGAHIRAHRAALDHAHQARAEQAARRADQMLRKAIESFYTSIMITDPKGVVVLDNRLWRQLIGDAHDATCVRWPDILRRMVHAGHYPDCAPGHEEAFIAWRLSLRDSGQTAEMRFKDRWLLVRDDPLDDGSTLHFAMDITEHKAAAEKLRVSEELYRSVAATIRDGLLIVDLQGRVVAMNPAAGRILGMQTGTIATDLREEDFQLLEDDLFTPLPRDRWPLQETIATGQRITDRVVPARRADREIVWLQMSSNLLRLDAQTPPFAAVATFRDITQERLAVQELALSEERWKFALEGAGDGVWDWDMLSGAVYYSSRWKHMLGYQDHEISDTVEELFSRIHPQDRDVVSHSTMQYMTDDAPVHQVEFRLRHRDGHYLHILSRGKVVSRSREGAPLRVVGTHSDISHIKEAERAQRERQLAEAASAAKSEFLSRMSHEIRTPLNAIQGFAQLLRLQMGHDGTPSAQRSYVEQILHAGHHLSGLVNDVLDLQQVESGAISLKLEDIRLDEEIVQCLSMLLPMAEQREISMSSYIDPDATVRADRQRLRQVLMNIGSNAIKYNRHGGSVVVRAQVTGASSIELSLADQGPGMTTDQLARLFQPFERLGRETSNIEGTGLGLIITRSLIESMGGCMAIDSRPGSGTRVNITLPRAGFSQLETEDATSGDGDRDASVQPNDSPVPTPPPPAAPACGQALRVLYVEDNRINALLFAEALRPYEQIELDIAEDGELAMSMAQERPPEVLVLDAHLPGMSGFEVLAALRQIPGLENVPAYMCSADAMPDDLARAKAAGFAGYWTKPIDIVAVTTELCRLAQRGDNAAP